MQVVKMDKAMSNDEWISDDGIELEDKDLPIIKGYHVLLRPVYLRDKTKGGIYLPGKIVDDINYLTTVAKVVLLGDLAYRDKEKFPLGPWCKKGDYVCYGKHTGQKLVYKGIKLLLIFDDQVIMQVGNPKDLDTTFNLTP